MQGIGEWIRLRAGWHPNRTALVGSDRTLTYGELDERANRLANGLKDRYGIGKGDRLAILTLNCLEFMELFVAAARLGAILVPLNFRLTAGELQYQLANSGSRLLVLGPEQASMAPELLSGTAVEAVIDLTQTFQPDSAFETLLAEASALPVDGSHSLDTPQLIVYTSGTTGRPKGAVLTQGNIVGNALNNTMILDITSQDSNLVLLPLFHVGGIGLFNTPTLFMGGTVLIPRKFDPVEAMEWIQKYRATLYLGVPTINQALLPLYQSGKYDWSSMRRLLSGGAACPLDLIDAYSALGLPIAQGYGMTETAPTVFLQPDRDGPGKPGTIGKAAGFCLARILREDLTETAVDEVGEITMKGPNVFAGYWQNPEATAAAFDKDGWFHSGDLARRDADGYVTIMGRKKDMIISGAENIYPMEVENLLLTHPAVADVAVFGSPDARWGEVPMAAVVLRPGAAATAEDLIAFMQGRLARYKQPKAIHFVDALPRNALGKVVKPELTRRFA